MHRLLRVTLAALALAAPGRPRRRLASPAGRLARGFAERIGGNLRRAETHYGEREFVEGPAPAAVWERSSWQRVVIA